MLQPNENHMLCVLDDENGELVGELCEEISVVRKEVNLSTGNITLLMALWIDGIRKEFRLDRGLLSKRQCMTTLVQQGITILDSPENLEAVLEYILESDQKAPRVYTHDCLGFNFVDNQRVFLANGIIGGQKESRYVKPEITAPQGTLESWEAVITQDVLGHSHLELALAISFSAPLVYLLQQQKLFCENPIWTLLGATSTGKTSVLRLMASIYGSPSAQNGLIHTFHCTENAFFAQLAMSRGLPHLVDEATRLPSWDFANVFYSLSTGTGRVRCKANGELNDQKHFSGPVIFTSERSLLLQTSVEPGTFARVCELTLDWFDDADHARRISTAVQQNFGTAVIPYVTKLLKIADEKPDILERMFRKDLECFRHHFPKVRGDEERLLNTYTTVVMAARIAKKALSLPFDIRTIQELLVTIHNSAPKQADTAKDLYDAIMDDLAQHHTNYPSFKGTSTPLYVPSTLYGEQAVLNKKDVLWVTKDRFEEIVRKNGIQNYDAHLKQLYEKNLVEKFSDRYCTKHSLNHNSARCYCFRKQP